MRYANLRTVVEHPRYFGGSEGATTLYIRTTKVILV